MIGVAAPGTPETDLDPISAVMFGRLKLRKGSLPALIPHAAAARELVADGTPELLLMREGEPRRHDADDGVHVAAEAELAPDDRGIAPEARLPDVVADHENVGRAGALVLRQQVAAEHRLHARHELAHAERLGQVIVGAGLEPEHLVRLLTARRQHQDRRVLVGRLAADRAADADAVEPGQHDVEHDQVEVFRARQAQRLGAVGRRQHGKALELEVQRDQFANRRIVFDDQHATALAGFGVHVVPV